MRCDDLTRELARPTGSVPSAEVAGHLAACPGCAERSRRAAHLDRIWEATRPPGPSADALDALWARASIALDADDTAPAPLSFERAARRRRRLIVAFAIAQAAAVLIAAVVLGRRDGPGSAPRTLVALATPVRLEVETDQTAIVRIDQHNTHRVDVRNEAIPAASTSIPPDSQHDVFDGAEGMLPDGWGSVVSR